MAIIGSQHKERPIQAGWAFLIRCNPAGATRHMTGKRMEVDEPAEIVVDVIPDNTVSYVMSQGISVVIEPKVRVVA
jgi:hypothetical protein